MQFQKRLKEAETLTLQRHKLKEAEKSVLSEFSVDKGEQDKRMSTGVQ